MNKKPPGPDSRRAQLEHRLVDLFRRNGWDVRAEVREQDRMADFVACKPAACYAIELKVASEGRRDRIVPLMAQAILQAQAASRHLPGSAAPLAVVAAPRIRDVVVKQVLQFAARHAPDVAIGLLDLDGLQVFSGSGLGSLNESRPRSSEAQEADSKPGDPFSDLNQWMLKVLLARYLGEDSGRFLHAPALAYKNASELAKAAQVSVMSASRFVRLMKEQGFLHEGGPPLRLVRLDDLLDLWQASYARPVKDVPVRWILRGQPDAIPRALKAYGEFACLGLFAAAKALGYGFVQGAPVHMLVHHVDAHRLKRMRLALAEPGEKPDLLLRVPSARESVFRGMAIVDHLKVCDVLQAWLDVRQHPARGKEQAHHLWKRAIKPMIQRAQSDVD